MMSAGMVAQDFLNHNATPLECRNVRFLPSTTVASTSLNRPWLTLSNSPTCTILPRETGSAVSSPTCAPRRSGHRPVHRRVGER